MPWIVLFYLSGIATVSSCEQFQRSKFSFLPLIQNMCILDTERDTGYWYIWCLDTCVYLYHYYDNYYIWVFILCPL